jgi:hypothetical protein
LGDPALTVAEAVFSYFLKFSLNIEATFLRVSLNYSLFFQEFAGFNMFLSTPSIFLGYERLKIGRVSISLSLILPSWIALIIFLVF